MKTIIIIVTAALVAAYTSGIFTLDESVLDRQSAAETMDRTPEDGSGSAPERGKGAPRPRPEDAKPSQKSNELDTAGEAANQKKSRAPKRAPTRKQGRYAQARLYVEEALVILGESK